MQCSEKAWQVYLELSQGCMVPAGRTATHCLGAKQVSEPRQGSPRWDVTLQGLPGSCLHDSPAERFQVVLEWRS